MSGVRKGVRSVKKDDPNPEEQAVEMSSVQTEEIPSSSTEEVENLESVETQEEEKASDSGEEETKDKNRLEKRIDKLQDKLDQAKSPEDRERIEALLEKLRDRLASYGTSEYGVKREPLVTEEDAEQGLSAGEINRRFVQNLEAVKEEAKNEAVKEVEARLEFERILKEHKEDFDRVKTEHPELDPDSDRFDKDLYRFVEKQYRLVNSVLNPFTGQPEFLPSVKYSEIYNDLRLILERQKTLAQADVSGKIVRDISVSSAPISGRQEEEADLESLQSELWRNPAKVAEELRRRLSK